MNDSDVSITGSVTLRRTNATAMATTAPTPTPRTTASPKSTAVEANVTLPTATIAAAAVRSDTSAVASLSSDSPSRIVTIRRGRPIRRATAVAATASGGATTAPRAKATANGTGISHHVTRPTPAAVNSTSPTDSARIDVVLARKSTSEVRTAAAYNRGGSRP